MGLSLFLYPCGNEMDMQELKRLRNCFMNRCIFFVGGKKRSVVGIFWFFVVGVFFSNIIDNCLHRDPPTRSVIQILFLLYFYSH